MADRVEAAIAARPAYRLHVRLKPELPTYAEKLSEGLARAGRLLMAKAAYAPSLYQD